MIRSLAEAGSTKIDWIYDIDNSCQRFTTAGWNPSQNTEDLLLSKEHLKLLKNTEQLYYYGSGVGTAVAEKRAQAQLQNLIGAKAKVNVYSDVLASAKATLGDREGIACILGTGSNVAYHAKGLIHQNIPSLGYLLSDEGSGYAIGRSIIKSYFYNKMPEDIRVQFETSYELDRAKLFEGSYQSSAPNLYISNYARFLEKIDGPWKGQLLHKIFLDFLENQVLVYKNFLSVPIGFTGSIAHHYRDHLRYACEHYDITDIHIIERPIDALLAYHLDKS